jgi:O-antigen/teichoic acid export membrane protein
MAWRYRRFPLIGGLSALLGGAGLYLPTPLLSASYGPEVAGWFLLTQRIVGAPLLLVAMAIAQVYLARGAELVRQGNAPGVWRLFLRTGLVLALLATPPVVVLAAVAPWLVSEVFGASWLEAGVYLRILAPAFLLQFVVSPLSQTLNLLERQDLQAAWDLARLVLTLGGILLAARAGLPAAAAVGSYAVVAAVCYGGHAGLCLWAMAADRRRKGTGPEPAA